LLLCVGKFRNGQLALIQMSLILQCTQRVVTGHLRRQPLVSVVHRVAGGYAVEPRYVEEDEQDYEIDTVRHVFSSHVFSSNPRPVLPSDLTNLAA